MNKNHIEYIKYKKNIYKNINTRYLKKIFH